MNRKELLLISITVFLTLIGWITADIYHEFMSGRRPGNIPQAPVIKDYNIASYKETLDLLKTKQE